MTKNSPIATPFRQTQRKRLIDHWIEDTDDMQHRRANLRVVAWFEHRRLNHKAAVADSKA